MTNIQQNHSNGFSPILLSPSTTTHSIIPPPTNNHINIFDNSDQGSVDSDYTSLGSSKFYGNGGSTSSLNRQGRSQSIDELASSSSITTTTIPTRHFNGTLNVHKFNNDPLQFVKIHPNHDLIERAQEQLTLLESRKRLQENFKLNNQHNTNSNKIITDDDETNWSKAVENWRQKREQKRKQSLSSTRSEDEPITPISTIEPSTPPSPIKKFDEHTKPKPTFFPPSSPPPARTTVVSQPSTTTNTSTRQLTIPNRTASKSPSPQRFKGPARIHDVFIQKPVDVRGFGFKLEGGSAQNRPVYISTLEDGSAADKAGLSIDDEVLAMNDENIEHMTFEQVRKILKERILRGSIKLTVRTYDDALDENSQTVTTGPTTAHSRTPSPQKPLSTTQSNVSVSKNEFNRITISPPKSSSTTQSNVTIIKTEQQNRSPSPQKPSLTSQTSTSTTTSTIVVSSPTPPTVQSPIYTFLPYTPPPSSSNPTSDVPIQQTPGPSLNIFAPKPFRSTASINLETQNTNEKNMTHSSPIEAFRKMLDPSNSISKSMKNETTGTVEQEQVSSSLKTTISKSISRDNVSTVQANPPLKSSLSITNNSKSSQPVSPPPLSSVESLLHGTSDFNSNDQQRNESPIAQVRSSVEKQMNQLQQELLLGFPHSQTSREQRQVNIPIDFTNAGLRKSPILKSSISVPSSIEQQDLNTNNYNRNYSQTNTSNENTNLYYESINQQQQQRPSSSYTKRPVNDIPITITNRPSTANTYDRSVNQLRVNISSPPPQQQQQKKVSLQIDEKIPQQRVTSKQLHTTLNQAPKKSHYDDHSWITDDQRKAMMTPPPPSTQPQLSSYNNGRNTNDRRSASLNPHHQDLQTTRQTSDQLTMFHYGDHNDESHRHYQQHHQSRSTQQRDFNPSMNRYNQVKQQRKSPVRTTVNTNNNNRILSVSGKLRCSRCNDELGQGSAMVIESLGLYYHIECFRCYVCNIPLSSSFEGTDVRVRSNRLHCQNCFSDENGDWRPNV